MCTLMSAVSHTFRSEVSSGQIGDRSELSGHFGPVFAGPKCPITGSTNGVELSFLLHDALCALRGIATVSRPSVRPSVRRLSVRLSVTLMYHGRISWVTSKIITRIIRLGSSLLGAPTSAIRAI